MYGINLIVSTNATHESALGKATAYVHSSVLEKSVIMGASIMVQWQWFTHTVGQEMCVRL